MRSNYRDEAIQTCMKEVFADSCVITIAHR